MGLAIRVVLFAYIRLSIFLSEILILACDSSSLAFPIMYSESAVMLQKILESSFHCKEIKPVSHKGNLSWKVTGGTNAEAEAPILWPPDVKAQLIRKGPGAGKDWGQDGWMASPTQQTWDWASSRRLWRIGRSGELQAVGSQRLGYDWVTE